MGKLTTSVENYQQNSQEMKTHGMYFKRKK